ncbi:hypothetical protein RvY_10635 [Ramazzottius varieornatus]|uniref:T-box domain-containing protein n=1 Tax=Ramazzottius varieornatus TaxID=947166 RepID=A0A1D1VDE4_RAMVA|nr:hypothetical protein RvY_10635 [Ramazzottius varieornatus]
MFPNRLSMSAGSLDGSFFPSMTAMTRGPVNYTNASLAALSGMSVYQSDPNIKVTLENRDMWERFNRHTTEMIITKTGRRMFPVMKMSISGLDKNARYYVVIDMAPVDDVRYKFHGSEWVASGKADPHHHGRCYVHPDSPASGSQWMRQPLSFSKVKLTNNNFDQNSQIILNSMHKYQPRIAVIRAEDMVSFNYIAFNIIAFPETAFIAVTAYQNEQITRLKIDNNPFAKGFRDLHNIRKVEEKWSGKRSLSQSDPEEEESRSTPVKTKYPKVVSELEKSLALAPDSSCSPVNPPNSCQPVIPYFPALGSQLPHATAWQQQCLAAQSYMNYFYPHHAAASWMLASRFPVTAPTHSGHAASPSLHQVYPQNSP